jgi:hypothetical protein
MMTVLIMIGATVAYFAVAIPLAMWIGKWIQRRLR